MALKAVDMLQQHFGTKLPQIAVFDTGFHATLAGLEAPVVITTEGSDQGAVRLRLPVDPGGLSASLRAERLHVEAVAGPGEIFAVMGRHDRPTRWVEAAMVASDHGGTLDLPMLAGETWAIASQDTTFEHGRGVRAVLPCPLPATLLQANARWAGWIRPPAPPRPLRRIYDGAARVAVVARRQRAAVRMVAFELLALSIGAEIALVLRAALSRADPKLAGIETGRSARLRTVAAAIALLLIAGLVLALRAVMEIASE